MSRRFRPLACASGAALALLGIAGNARAQAVLERFDPAERGSRFFLADSLELDGDLRVAAGVVTSYGHRLRTFRQAPGPAEQSRLVDHSLWMHAGGSLVMAPGVRFGLDVPIVAQAGHAETLDRSYYPAPSSPRVGDVRASFDLRIAGRARTDVDGATLAVGVSAYIPTGSSAAYTSDGFARISLRVASAVQLGPLLGAARVGTTLRRGDLAPFAGVPIGSEANALLALGLRSARVVVGPELAATTFFDGAFQRPSTPIEALLGAHFDAGDVHLGAGIGTLVLGGLGAAPLRGVVSVEWAPASYAARDRDHDGVLDADDVCPDVPGLANAPIGARGCPAPPRDGDGDGVVDTEDACPDLPGLRTGDPMTHGCPDADRDGIPDPIDACPDEPGERSVLPRFNGCPPDRDGDGVPDAADACPDEPGEPTDDPATNGCRPSPPLPADRDGDGVLDPADACVDVPGVRSTLPELDGCPVDRPEGTAKVQLAFAAGTATLTPESDTELARLATALVAYPDLRLHLSVLPVPRARVDAPWARVQRGAIVERLIALGVAADRFDPRRANGLARKRQLEVRAQLRAP
jgi:hypothetical protein